VRQDERAPFTTALQRARDAAYLPGEHVGQESFMRASEIRVLAERAGIGRGVSVLDLCCGVAGPGRLLAGELRCSYLGVDVSESAVAIARERAAGLACRFEVARVPPLPAGTFDVVLLLETMLAFRDKERLASAVAEALRPGGRFAFTLEEGAPLDRTERRRMPDADTVWLTPRDDLVALLARAGLDVVYEADHTALHRATADALAAAFAADADAIAAQVGAPALDDLLAAHRLWSGWLWTGRVRKLAFVAERR
jgi:SAM-dependent methyltransferase